jgi:hypothetical protein
LTAPAFPRRIERALAGRALTEPPVADVLRAAMDLADIEDDAARSVLQAIAGLIDEGKHPARATIWTRVPDGDVLRMCEAASGQIVADTDDLIVAVAKCSAARLALRAVKGAQP